MSSPYSDRYYRGIEPGSNRSARAVVPIVLRLFPSETVVDVGCGLGAWLAVYAEAGCDVLGVDSDRVPTDRLLIENDRFRVADLEQPLRLERRFDLVTCLEVAEHLSPGRAAGLVSDLCRLGDVVVFSAAVPGQGGTRHVNEQWPGYWIELFGAHRYEPLDCVRHRIWTDPEVEWWYAQNLFAFVKADRLADFPDAVAESRGEPTDLVHPRAFVRTAVPAEMTPRMLKEVARALPYFPAKIAARLRRPE